MLPPWRRTLTATGEHSDPGKMLANTAASPRHDRGNRAASVREHNDHHHHCQDHCIDDWPRYGQALRRQRRREKDQAELKNQQDR
jgi:hypothetical protein